MLIGAGVELIGYPAGDPRMNIDFGNDSIAIDYQNSATWTNSSFNGLEITGFTGLGSVILNTNMVGLDLGDFTIADNLLPDQLGGAVVHREHVREPDARVRA